MWTPQLAERRTNGEADSDPLILRPPFRIPQRLEVKLSMPADCEPPSPLRPTAAGTSPAEINWHGVPKVSLPVFRARLLPALSR